MRFAIVDVDSIVTNVVMWDGNPMWGPPAGSAAVRDDAGSAQIGYVYDEATKVFGPPLVATGGAVATATFDPVAAYAAATTADAKADVLAKMHGLIK